MNEQNFDRLFKDNLAEFQQAPPVKLAGSLEARLNRRQWNVWLQFSKVAAALALIVISVYLVGSWRNSGDTKVSIIAAKKPLYTLREPSLPNIIGTENQLPSISIMEEPSSIADTSNDEPVAVTGESENTSLENNGQTQIKPGHQQKNTSALLTESPQVKTAEPSVKRGKVTITYKKSNPASQPQLALQEAPKEKPKGFKKLWKKAKKVDYQSFSLAGIRATKDELLAINKKSKNKQTKSD